MAVLRLFWSTIDRLARRDNVSVAA